MLNPVKPMFKILDKLNKEALTYVIYTKSVSTDPDTDLIIQTFTKKTDQELRNSNRFDYIYYGNVTELEDQYIVNNANFWFTKETIPVKHYLSWLNRRNYNHVKTLIPMCWGDMKYVYHIRCDDKVHTFHMDTILHDDEIEKPELRDALITSMEFYKVD